MNTETQFMAREELGKVITQVKNRQEGASLLLWEGVSRFVFQQARKRNLTAVHQIPQEDLVQVGFIAMMEAVDKFDTTQAEYSFLSCLAYGLQTNFAKEAGTRTSKRDGLLYAVSGDMPVTSSGEDESFTIFSTLADEQGETPFIAMEWDDFKIYCRELIQEALDSLAEPEGEIIRLNYLEGWTLEQIATKLEKSRSRVGELAKRGLFRLSEGAYSSKLREALYSFGDFETLELTARYGGLTNYRKTGSSAVEVQALLRA